MGVRISRRLRGAFLAVLCRSSKFAALLSALILLASAGVSQAQNAPVVARIEVEPIETLRMSDFDPLNPSAAPVVFRTYVTGGGQALTIRLDVDVESARFGYLGTTRLQHGALRPGEMIVRTNREFDEYDLGDASSEVVDIATERGVLPPDDYFFTLRVVNVDDGEEVGTDTGVITTTNSGLQIDLVGPGTSLDQEPDIVPTAYPIFQWFSSASSFDFALYEVREGQRSAEDIVAGLPVFSQQDVAPGTFVYPNAAEDLVEGKVYAWQISAISVTSSGPERFPSELLWFTVEGAENPLDDRLVPITNVSRIEVTPQESEVAPGGSVVFTAMAVSSDDLPVHDAKIQWSVVPASVGRITSDGVFTAADDAGVAAVVARVGKVEEFATIVVATEDDTSPEEVLPVGEETIAMLAPVQGQTVMESEPTFSWQFMTSDSSAIASFRIALSAAEEIGADPESAAPLWAIDVPSATTAAPYPSQHDALQTGNEYFVTVAALDSSGTVVMESEPTSFVTILENKLSFELQTAWEEARQDNRDSSLVRLLLRSPGAVSTQLLADLERIGAILEIVEGPWIQIQLPFVRLHELAALDLVRLVTLPSPHVYLEAPDIAFMDTHVSDDVPLRKIRRDARLGPVDVAVFEFGFDPAVIGEMIPDVDIRYHSFRADKRIEGSGGADTRHGTAVVRALLEYLPPNATVHLVNFDTEPEFHHALDYVVHELGVKVVTCSVSWANAYDHYDGTSYFSRRIEEILGTSTPLVVAAGNFAQSHWQADYGDTDSDGTHDFDPRAEMLELKLSNGRFYNFMVSWNDWGGNPRTDLDVEVYNAAGELLLDRRGRPYASRSVQGPSEYAEPVERIRGFKPMYPGTRSYYIRIYQKRNTPDPALRETNFELYVSPPPEGGLPGPVGASSLAAGLATTNSKLVIPIGANDLSHSSQGPTNDGRIRPDFSAKGVVDLGGAQIRGTSFATPRIAAALSLVFSRHPDWSVEQAYDFLRRFAVQPDGSAGKNDRFGWGQVDLDALVEALTS